MVETRMSTKATTLTTGSSVGRRIAPRIHIGIVSVPGPAVKLVTMISSKLSANASRPPESNAVPIEGRDRPYGSLLAGSRTPRELVPAELDLLRDVAQVIGTAVAVERMQELAERLRAQ